MQRRVRGQPRSHILWLWCHLVLPSGCFQPGLPERRYQWPNCSKNHCYCLPCKKGAVESPNLHPPLLSLAFLWGWEEAELSLELQELKVFLPGAQERRGCACKANLGAFWITLRAFSIVFLYPWTSWECWSRARPYTGNQRMRERCTTPPKTWL